MTVEGFYSEEQVKLILDRYKLIFRECINEYNAYADIKN